MIRSPDHQGSWLSVGSEPGPFTVSQDAIASARLVIAPTSGNPDASGAGRRAEWPPVSGANDPYDPKQVAALAPEALDDAVRAAVEAFGYAGNLEELAAVRPAHLGDRAPVLLARRELGALPPAARSDAGKRVNAARDRKSTRLNSSH